MTLAQSRIRLTATHQKQSQALLGKNIQTKDHSAAEMHGARCYSQPVCIKIHHNITMNDQTYTV